MILINKFLFHKNYVGLTLWPFIILKNDALKNDLYLINHEKIHLRQQKEMLIIPFYLFYVIEWLVRTVFYLNSYKAYQNLSFEREAYRNEHNLNYLYERRPFSFYRHLYN